MRIKAYKIDYRFLSWADLSESEQRKFPELFDDIESRDLCRFIRDNNRIYEFDEFNSSSF